MNTPYPEAKDPNGARPRYRKLLSSPPCAAEITRATDSTLQTVTPVPISNGTVVTPLKNIKNVRVANLNIH